MGNRAVITTVDRKIGLYVHWNGGRDTIQPLLKYCELKGFRPPSSDSYGWARLCQVLGNFFGGTLSVGIGPYTTDRRMDPGDNGIYVIDGWRIVERLTTDYDEDFNAVGMIPYPESQEQSEYGFDKMLKAFDECMPEEERLGVYLDSVEIPVSELKLGDMVWMRGGDDKLEAYPVVGFGIEPVETKNGIVIAVDPNAPHAPKMVMALEKWNEQRKALRGGDISQVEYALWRGDFGGIDEDEAGERQ